HDREDVRDRRRRHDRDGTDRHLAAQLHDDQHLVLEHAPVHAEPDRQRVDEPGEPGRSQLPDRHLHRPARRDRRGDAATGPEAGDGRRPRQRGARHLPRARDDRDRLLDRPDAELERLLTPYWRGPFRKTRSSTTRNWETTLVVSAFTVMSTCSLGRALLPEGTFWAV